MLNDADIQNAFKRLLEEFKLEREESRNPSAELTKIADQAETAMRAQSQDMDGCVYAFMDALKLPLSSEQAKAAQDWKENVAREKEACGGQIVQAHSLEEVMGIRDCWIRPRPSKLNHFGRELS